MKKYDKQVIFSRISDLPGNFTLQRRSFAIHFEKYTNKPPDSAKLAKGECAY